MALYSKRINHLPLGNSYCINSRSILLRVDVISISNRPLTLEYVTPPRPKFLINFTHLHASLDSVHGSKKMLSPIFCLA